MGEVVQEVKSRGQNISSVALDVRSQEEWQRAVKATVKEFGGLDVLINNAGVVTIKGVEETDMETWDRVIGTNLTGTWLGMKYCCPAICESGGGGAVVNIGSVWGRFGCGGSVSYHASKSGLSALVKTAAIEYGPEGIRINLIQPGAIDTLIFTEKNVPGADQIRAEFIPRVPLGRMGESIEVANAALFLASDEASYITGAEPVVDGGRDTN